MSFLQHKTKSARQTIAFGVAIGVGVVLVGVMIWVYTRPQKGPENDAGRQIADFYTTIVDNAQSYFGGKSDTIE